MHFASLILVGVEKTVITPTSLMLQQKPHLLHRKVGYEPVNKRSADLTFLHFFEMGTDPCFFGGIRGHRRLWPQLSGSNLGTDQFLLSYFSFYNNFADCMCIPSSHTRNRFGSPKGPFFVRVVVNYCPCKAKFIRSVAPFPPIVPNFSVL